MAEEYQENCPPTAQDMQVLCHSFLFEGMEREEQSAALRLITPERMCYLAGERVVTAGTHFAAIGLVTAGSLAVTRGGERRPVIHRTLLRGDTFGVSSLFGEEANFPTNVTAAEDATVLLITEADVRTLITHSPQIALRYVTLLTEKIRFLNTRLDTLAGRSAEERVAAHLLSHANGALGITKSALASLLGLGRASLYRILEMFEEEGLIRSHRESIEVPDPEKLRLFIKNRKENQ